MSNDTVIEVNSVSKQYRLGEVGTGTLSHDLNRIWHRILKKEDPYKKLGEINDRSEKSNSSYVDVLNDISLKVNKGDVVGIIGGNGAGKSTLLKILSKITGPTAGNINISGRVASLLEVGTGFHPELTGRENIYMNGTIMGMTKKEIDSKLDEIVAFAGVEKYLDTPTKRYSSGMTVRLGFAIAAYLEPEILIVDEVLAVGDLDFQKKAIGKMREVSESSGRTVLFVSHNMEAVANLCSRAIVLDKGRVAFDGDTVEAINFYTKKVTNVDFVNPVSVSDSYISKVTLLNDGRLSNGIFEPYDNVCLKIEVGDCQIEENSEINCIITNKNGELISYSASGLFQDKYVKPNGCIYLSIDVSPLVLGTYSISLVLRKFNFVRYSRLDDIVFFKVKDRVVNNNLYHKRGQPKVYLSSNWHEKN